MLYYVDGLNEINEEQYCSLIEECPDWRRDILLRYHRREDRVRSAAAFALLCRGLGFVPGEFVYNEYGKPFLPNGEKNFSIAHSGSAAFVGISENVIGVDCEKINSPPIETMRRIFTDGEIKAVEMFGGDMFYRLWTLKESYVKAIGRGLYFGLKNIEFEAVLSEGGFDFFGSDRSFAYRSNVCGGCAFGVSAFYGEAETEMKRVGMEELIDIS